MAAPDMDDLRRGISNLQQHSGVLQQEPPLLTSLPGAAILRRLDRIDQRLDRIDRRLARVYRVGARLQRTVTGLRRDVESLKDTTRYQEERTVLRQKNLCRSHLHEDLFPFPDNNGSFPDGFPQSAEAIFCMRAAVVDNLLQAYNLRADENLPQKRRRLADFIGAQVR